MWTAKSPTRYLHELHEGEVSRNHHSPITLRVPDSCCMNRDARWLVVYGAYPFVVIQNLDRQPLALIDRLKADEPVLATRVSYLGNPSQLCDDLARALAHPHEIIPVVWRGYRRHAESIQPAAVFPQLFHREILHRSIVCHQSLGGGCFPNLIPREPDDGACFLYRVGH